MHVRSLGVSLAALLAAALIGSVSPASAQGYGPGMMGGYGPGYGPGMMQGWGPGYGPGMMGGYGPGMMGGYGPGYGMMGGYGAGYGMMGGYGPGYGYGPGMMRGWGPGYGAHGYAAPSGQEVSVDDVKNQLERWLTLRGNPNLKVGEVKQKDDNTIEASIVTKDNSLVERYLVNRHTGFWQPERG